MRLGFGLGVTALARPVVAAVAPVLSAINADGWSGPWNAAYGALPAYSTGDSEFAPNTSPIYVPLVRKGYDATGALRTDIQEAVVVTRRVRQPWSNGTSNHLLGDASGRVALSGYVLSTDTPVGVGSNNSQETSPRPVAQQCDRNRRVIGDSALCQMRAYHWAARNGKPVAAAYAWFRSTDGTKETVRVLMSGPKVLSHGGNDRFAVIGYDATVPTNQWSDGTPIPDGTTLVREMDVRPWIGDAASIRTTVGDTVDGRGFTPQSFYKHTARAGAPLYVHVNQSSGVDETVSIAGVGSTSGAQKVSTTAAGAKAQPFATIAKAIEALKAATTLTSGFTDGCFVHLAAGTYTSPATTQAGTYQSGGELIIETDPTAAPYSAILTGSASTFRQSYITYRKVHFQRSVSTVAWSSLNRVAIYDCTIDHGTQTTVPFGGTTYINGLTVTGGSAPFQSGIGAATLNLCRGLQGGTSKGTAFSVDAFNLTGCLLYNAVWNNAGRSNSGTICDSFANLGITGTFAAPFNASENVDGYVLANYIIEYASTVSNPALRPSGDGATANVTHFINWYGSYGGASLYGRWNIGYDETTGTLRTHKHWSQIGMIPVSHYTKHDWFLGSTAAAGTTGDATRAEAPQHTGAWSVMYQVNSRGNWIQFPTDSGAGPAYGPNGDRVPAFYGLKAKYLVGTASQFVRNDPKFAGGTKKATDYDGTTVSGANGGVAADYMPAADSGLIGVLTAAEEALPLDITGAARNRGTLGAYA